MEASGVVAGVVVLAAVVLAVDFFLVGLIEAAVAVTGFVLVCSSSALICWFALSALLLMMCMLSALTLVLGCFLLKKPLVGYLLVLAVVFLYSHSMV